MQLTLPITKQTKKIYSLLLKKGPMNAKQISKELHIFPHAVYRSTKHLRLLGCIRQRASRPTLYEAIEVKESVESVVLLTKELFLQTFLKYDIHGTTSIDNVLNISFIESREMMFEKAQSDIDNVHDEMCNLASGDELPAEIMLAQKRALERGVIIKTIFQKRTKENESFIQARVKMGEIIRIAKSLNTRVVIFDRRIVYIMSYDPDNYIKSIGIRFEYAALGQLMYQLFSEQWEHSLDI